MNGKSVVIGRFEKVDNPHGFDIRRVTIVLHRGKYRYDYQWLKISDYYHKDLPVFIAKTQFADKREYRKQFDDYLPKDETKPALF